MSASLAAATSSNLQGTTIIRIRNPETRTHDREGIAAYDETLRAYYRSRTGGKKDTTWTADMSGLLGKESRPHMRDFLARRRFNFR